jgi:ABC-type transport system substrate-binding protein
MVTVVIVVLIVLSGVIGYFAGTTTAGNSTSTVVSTVTTNSVATETVTTNQAITVTSPPTTSSTTQATQTGKYGGTLTMAVDVGCALGYDPDITGGGSACDAVYFMVFDGLVVQDFQGNIRPDLAVNWTESSNGMSYVFALRQGVKYHDGTSLNAQSVKWGFDRLFSNQSNTLAGSYAMVNRTEVVNDYAIKFVLNYPSVSFLLAMAYREPIVSPTAVQKYGSGFTWNPVGTGAFEFVNYVPNDHLTFQANPNYWLGRPYLDQVIVRIVPDVSVRALSVQTGEVQLTQLTPDQASTVKSNPNVVLKVGLPTDTNFLSMDMNQTVAQTSLLTNLLVRQAINYAINRTQLVGGLTAGFGVPAVGPITPSLVQYYDPSLQVYPPNGDITMAKALLSQAGYPKGINLTLVVAADRQNYADIAQVLQQQLAMANIHVNLVSSDWNTVVNTILTRKGNWQLTIHDWAGSSQTPAGVMGDFYNSTQTGVWQWNLQYAGDPILDYLLAKLKVATDTATISVLSNEAQSRIIEQAYGAPLYYIPNIEATSSKLVGFQTHPNVWYENVICIKAIGYDVWLSG